MILIHKRSDFVDNPNLICGPGGSRESYHKNDYEALNTELSEESLGGIIKKTINLKWEKFSEKDKTSSYWTNGTNLKIKGPDEKHEIEVDMEYKFNNLKKIEKEIIKETGHAWLSLEDCINFDEYHYLFLSTFINNLKILNNNLKFETI